jgi:hypothetical protein
VVAPKLVGASAVNVPPLIVVPPVYMFAPLRISVPKSSLLFNAVNASRPGPLTTPDRVIEPAAAPWT